MGSPLLLIPPLVALVLVPHAPASVAGELCNPILLEFGFGIVVAVAMQHGLVSPRPWQAAVLAAAAAVILLVPSGGSGVRVLAFGLPACLIVAATAALEPWADRLPRRMLRLGDASYAIYLSHGFVMAALAPALPRIARAAGAGMAPDLWLALAVLASMALGEIIHLRLEKPLLRTPTARILIGGLQPTTQARPETSETRAR